MNEFTATAPSTLDRLRAAAAHNIGSLRTATVLGSASIIAGAGLASAQTTNTGNTVSADYGGITSAVGAFSSSLISTNSGPIMTMMLPIMGFIFIKNQARSVF